MINVLVLRPYLNFPCVASHQFISTKMNLTYLCVCVFLPIHSGHQIRWTYQPGPHRRKVTQDFSSTFFLWCVPYFFSREGFSHSFPLLLLLLLFLTFSALVANPKKNTLHGGQSRSWSAEQGKKEKEKVWQRPPPRPPPPARCSFGEKK